MIYKDKAFCIFASECGHSDQCGRRLFENEASFCQGANIKIEWLTEKCKDFTLVEKRKDDGPDKGCLL